MHRHMYKLYIYRYTDKIAHTHITNLPILLQLHVCLGICVPRTVTNKTLRTSNCGSFLQVYISVWRTVDPRGSLNHMQFHCSGQRSIHDHSAVRDAGGDQRDLPATCRQVRAHPAAIRVFLAFSFESHGAKKVVQPELIA